jgi:diphosphomevalonate decarboxylase
MPQATAQANANIAFIKYWGNRDDNLRLPANASISMNLDGLFAKTTVFWDERLKNDQLILNGSEQTGNALQRVSDHLTALRQRLNITGYAAVESVNNFPTGAGIASSAAAFAALTVAAVKAAGIDLTERELSTLARLGSGSASRSIPTGFVQWYAADTHEDSFAESVASPDYWDIVDIIAVVNSQHKAVESREGHQSANTSDLQNCRVAGADKRLEICKRALKGQDFAAFAEVVEQDSNLMHAVMMTSRPPLFYWLPMSLAIMEQVRRWRADGLQVCYTLDAGPNVHCICVRKDAEQVKTGLQSMSGIVNILTARPGGPAILLPSEQLNA